MEQIGKKVAVPGHPLHLFELSAKEGGTTGVLAGLINAAVISIAQYPWMGKAALLWWGLVVALGALRFRMTRRWFRTTDTTPGKLRTFRYEFYTLILLSSLLWAFAVLFFFDPGHPFQSFLLVFVAAGMTAGATVAYASEPIALKAFVIPLLSALCLRLTLEGGEYYVLALVTVYFGMTVLRIGSRQFARLQEIARLATENEGLLEQLRQTNQKMQETNDVLLDSQLEVAQSTKNKSEFLATMTHEIRTPLNGILGLSEVLSQSALRPEQKEIVDTLRTSGALLLSLINDILDFSKIEAEQLELESKPFDIRRAAEDIQRLFQPQTNAKGLDLILDINDKVPAVLVGDLARFQQIVINLVGNAIKFTAQGSVQVRIEVEGTADEKVPLRVEVIDTGIGIPEEKMHRLFQKFSQIDGSTARQYGGSGLGLAICKGLAERMGGSVGVQSRLGEGSVFSLHFRLPPAPPGTPAINVVNEKIEDAFTLPGQKPRTLVVDDNAVNRMVLAKFLTNMGCEVELAGDGVDAVTMARKQDYDIIFMDIAMPGMDGLEATRQIRELKKSKRPRILAVTASAVKTERDRCVAAGMDDYLTKPIRLRALQHAVQQLLQSLPAAQEVEKSSDAIDFRVVEDLLAFDDTDFFSELLGEFHRVCEESMAAFTVALAKGDSEKLSKIAHRLKGAARNLGAAHLAKLCEKMEIETTSLPPEEQRELIASIGSQAEAALDILKSSSRKAA